MILVREVLRPLGTQDLGEVVDDEAVTGGEHLRADRSDLPAGDVVVDAVEPRRVAVGVGQLVEQVGVLEHVRHGVRRVADEGHRGLGSVDAGAARERLVREVVLHHVDEVLVGASVGRELVERDAVPVTNQADAAAGVVDEELGDGDLATGDEDAVRGELAERVRLAGALRPEFDDVVVALDERDQASQGDELAALVELLGVEADRLHEQVDPFLGRERFAGLVVVVDVDAGDLDGLEAAEDPRHDALVVGVEVLDVADAPDTADEELGVLLDRDVVDDDALDLEVLELCLVDVVLLVERDGDLVDHAVAALAADLRLHEHVLVAVDVVGREDLPNAVDPGLDRCLVIRCGVLAQQVLQDVGRHHSVAPDRLDEVLADDGTGEVLVDLVVERGLRRGWHRSLQQRRGRRSRRERLRGSS